MRSLYASTMLHHVLSSFVGNGYLPFWWIDHFSATQTTRLGGWRSGRNRPRDGQVYLSNSKGHVGGKRLTAWEPLVWAWRDNFTEVQLRISRYTHIYRTLYCVTARIKVSIEIYQGNKNVMSLIWSYLTGKTIEHDVKLIRVKFRK